MPKYDSMKWFRLAAALAFRLLVLVGAAPAAAAMCSVNPQGVSFGNYDPLSTSALDGVGNINVTCDALVPLTVSLSSGSSGTYSERRMSSGFAYLRYNLYTDAGRNIVWGDGLGSSTVSDTGNNVDLPVYGRIPGFQNVPANAYADTIIVTVTF